MLKVAVVILTLCLVAAGIRIFDRSLEMDDLRQESASLRRQATLIANIGNYASGCAGTCDIDAMAVAFSKDYALSKAAPELQIESVRVRVVDGKIVIVRVSGSDKDLRP